MYERTVLLERFLSKSLGFIKPADRFYKHCEPFYINCQVFYKRCTKSYATDILALLKKSVGLNTKNLTQKRRFWTDSDKNDAVKNILDKGTDKK